MPPSVEENLSQAAHRVKARSQGNRHFQPYKSLIYNIKYTPAGIKGGNLPGRDLIHHPDIKGMNRIIPETGLVPGRFQRLYITVRVRRAAT